MDIVRLKPGQLFKSQVDILSIPPTQLVSILGGPESSVKLVLHWTDVGSLPCRGDKCTLHHLPPRPYGYVPVVTHYVAPNGEWLYRPAILPLTPDVFSLADEDFEGKILKVTRHQNRKTGTMRFEVARGTCKETEVTFDMMACLESLWQFRMRAYRLLATNADSKS